MGASREGISPELKFNSVNLACRNLDKMLWHLGSKPTGGAIDLVKDSIFELEHSLDVLKQSVTAFEEDLFSNKL